MKKSPVDDILQSKKYRHIGLPESTLDDILKKELQQNASPKEAVKSLKKKLHNIVAPYLGDPDYAASANLLEEAFSEGGSQKIRLACRQVLAEHASTRERLPILEEFYRGIFEVTGLPHTVLDLACGLNPLAFPWMGLPSQVYYHAYDIHAVRVGFINHFFELQGLAQLAEVRDVLLEPPQIEADVTFLFKEAHRLEQRQRGCNLPLWRALKTRWLLVSLPSRSLTGSHDLAGKHRNLVHQIMKEEDWPVTELKFGDEMVFCIEKGVEQG